MVSRTIAATLLALGTASVAESKFLVEFQVSVQSGDASFTVEVSALTRCLCRRALLRRRRPLPRHPRLPLTQPRRRTARR